MGGGRRLIQGYRLERHWFWALTLESLLPEEELGPATRGQPLSTITFLAVK